MTWKEALAATWKLRGRRHVVASLFVASVCGVAKIIISGFGPGLLTWALLAGAMFIIYVGEDARLQRKNARKEAARVSP